MALLNALIILRFYGPFTTNIPNNIQLAYSNDHNTSQKKSMQQAADGKKIKSLKNGQTNGITVSGNGKSWRKRGFSFFYLDSYTQHSLDGTLKNVVDFIVKSKYSKACEYWGKKIQKSIPNG